MVFIKELESLRGLMALWVVIGHWGQSIDWPMAPLPQGFASGHAVAVFFILSGFVITLLRDNAAESYGRFLVRRFFRLFPVYLVVLAVAALMLGYSEAVLQQAPTGFLPANRLAFVQSAREQFWPHLLAHATLLHGLVPLSVLPNTHFTFISPAWTLSVEWQFYLVAPLMIGMVFALPRPFAVAGIAAFVVIMELVDSVLGASALGHSYLHFGLGIASYLFWREVTQRKRLQNLQHLRAVMAVALIGCAFLLPALTPAAIWLTVLYVVLAGSRPGAPIERAACSMLRARPLRYLGQISYPVYVVHIIVLVPCLDVLNRLMLDPKSYAMALLVMMLSSTLAMSALLHSLIEKPAIELGRSFAARWPRREDTARIASG